MLNKTLIEIVQILINSGADPSIKAENGKTALDFAKSQETIKILKEHQEDN